MIKSKLRNFHVPLPDELYNLLHRKQKNQIYLQHNLFGMP